MPVFYERISKVMRELGDPWELILINDGSRDGSLPIMYELAASDDHIKLVHFARNFGHQTAVTAGVDFSVGKAVILIDSDLQDPPEVIPQLIDKWREGYEVVYAIRTKRSGESWFKVVTAKLFYRLLRQITDIDIPRDTGDFRLMDRKVANVLKQMREHNRFIRGMTSWVGYRQTGVLYEREKRYSGESKYPLRKMIQFAMDAVTSFSFFPIQIMIYVSFFLGFLSIFTGIIISLLRILLGPDFFGGQATTIVLILMLSSFQMFFLFLLGQYVARIYDETRARPLYIVAATMGLPPQDNVAEVSEFLPMKPAKSDQELVST